jgi:hypothetical protein
VQDEPLYLIDEQCGVVSAGEGLPFSDLLIDSMLVPLRRGLFQDIFVRFCEGGWYLVSWETSSGVMGFGGAFLLFWMNFSPLLRERIRLAQ